MRSDAQCACATLPRTSVGCTVPLSASPHNLHYVKWPPSRKRRAVRFAAKSAAESFLSYARPPVVSAKRLQPAQKNALSSVPALPSQLPLKDKNKIRSMPGMDYLLDMYSDMIEVWGRLGEDWQVYVRLIKWDY